MVGYYGDGAKAVKSGPKLADLLEFLAANTKAQHINILGYSAGATVGVEGIFSGPSTGANLVAAIQVADRLGPGHRVVTVQVDSGLKYLNGAVFVTT